MDLHEICMKSRKAGNGPLNKRLNFSGDPDHRLDTGIIFRIRHYWEIRKVVYQPTAMHDAAVQGMHYQASPKQL